MYPKPDKFQLDGVTPRCCRIVPTPGLRMNYHQCSFDSTMSHEGVVDTTKDFRK